MSVMREKKQVLNIHLLKDDAFKNKAPQKLLAQSLALEQDCVNKKVTHIGMEPIKVSHQRAAARNDDRGDGGGAGRDAG